MAPICRCSKLQVRNIIIKTMSYSNSARSSSLGSYNSAYSREENSLLQHVSTNHSTCRCRDCRSFDAKLKKEQERDEIYLLNLENQMSYDATVSKITRREKGEIVKDVKVKHKQCASRSCRVCNPVDVFAVFIEDYREREAKKREKEEKKQRIIEKRGRVGYAAYRVGGVLKNWYS